MSSPMTVLSNRHQLWSDYIAQNGASLAWTLVLLVKVTSGFELAWDHLVCPVRYLDAC